MDQIVYKQWVSTDRSTLETRCASAEEFVDTFCEKLELLHLLPTILSQERYICHLSYVIISDSLHHDTVAVHLFQKCFIAFLKGYLPESLHPKKIIYFSDGAASQYKNRKTFSICVTTEMTLVFLQSGIFQLRHMVKGLVMVWVEQ